MSQAIKNLVGSNILFFALILVLVVLALTFVTADPTDAQLAPAQENGMCTGQNTKTPNCCYCHKC